jgi:carbamoyl-phosphate synthase small subunit
MSGAFLASDVTTKKPYVVNPPTGVATRLKVAAIDLGIKGATPKAMAALGISVHVLPLETTFEEIKALSPDGVFLSNGPGDPAAMTDVVELVRKVLEAEIPFFGICFGHQILGRALGFETYKLPFGHRGINQPVIDLTTGKVEITAHNHGFAVAAPKDHEFKTVYGDGRVTHLSLNDNVVEGLELISSPAFSVQYHPESAAGPHDAAYLFKRFVDLMEKSKFIGVGSNA